ncbi:MAG: hypothetical protein ACM359_25155 [Bacillota bacterium]
MFASNAELVSLFELGKGKIERFATYYDSAVLLPEGVERSGKAMQS